MLSPPLVWPRGATRWRPLLRLVSGRALCGGLFALLITASRMPAQTTAYVPLGDPAYEDLDALERAGLVRDLLVGERPYSRAAFARFAVEAAGRRASSAPLSPRLQEALARLAARFGTLPKATAALTRTVGSVVLADAPARAMRANAVTRGIDAELALLRQRNYGRVIPTGLSLAIEQGLLIERPRLALEASGRAYGGVASGREANGGGSDGPTVDAQLLTASLRTVVGPLAIDVGRTPLLTGFGAHGGALLTDNARPADQLRVRFDRPLRLPGPLAALGRWQGTVSLATMGRNRDQPGSIFSVIRISGRPVTPLEIGFTYLNQQGGVGAPAASWQDRSYDLFLFFLSGGSLEKSDKVAGLDLRLSAPAIRSALYANFATTDDRGRFRQPAGGYWEDAIWVAGLEHHGLGPEGRLDLRLEGRHTGPNPHTHHQYTSGVTLDRRVIGDALGPDGEGLSLGVDWNGTHHRTRLTLAMERYRSDSANAMQIPGRGPWDWDWYRLTKGPDERRQRIMLDRRSPRSWRGRETTVMLGYERAIRFDFRDRPRHSAIMRVELRGGGRQIGR